jgi:cytidylate kinase
VSRNALKIAIDGPAASGKSTTAREVAKRLNVIYIDSGAMYRAVTLKAIRDGIPTTNFEQVVKIAENLEIRFEQHDSQTIIFMDNEDVSSQIRDPKVNNHINPVAANPKVREIMVRKQQELGKEGGVVMDGRDIGTVVFPDADLKVFMKASAEERAKRRYEELINKGISISFDDVLQEVRTRDRADSTRLHGPLKIAEDAIIIDTTALSIEEQILKIIALVKEIKEKVNLKNTN